MREKIFTVILFPRKRNLLSILYDMCLVAAIIIGTLPMAFKEDFAWFKTADIVCTAVFLVDYILRFSTADYKFHKKAPHPFLKYPFTPMAIVDLISMLPVLAVFRSDMGLGWLLKACRVLRVFRVFRVARYSKSIRIIVGVFKKSKQPLMAVGTLAFAYIVISALVIFNVEPESFATFYDAIYWATVSLTTMGYGDIYPVTPTGRLVTMISSVFGIAIVALPAGIITAGYMQELDKE